MKTVGSDAFAFQALEVARRNFGENKPLTMKHIWYLANYWVTFAVIGKVTRHDLRRKAIKGA